VHVILLESANLPAEESYHSHATSPRAQPLLQASKTTAARQKKLLRHKKKISDPEALSVKWSNAGGSARCRVVWHDEFDIIAPSWAVRGGRILSRCCGRTLASRMRLSASDSGQWIRILYWTQARNRRATNAFYRSVEVQYGAATCFFHELERSM
jgi:hypothetical protein